MANGVYRIYNQNGFSITIIRVNYCLQLKISGRSGQQDTYINSTNFDFNNLSAESRYLNGDTINYIYRYHDESNSNASFALEVFILDRDDDGRQYWATIFNDDKVYNVPESFADTLIAVLCGIISPSGQFNGPGSK